MGDTKIQWTDKSWSPLRARVKADAAEIATAKSYTSMIRIATKMAGHVGPHCERVSLSARWLRCGASTISRIHARNRISDRELNLPRLFRENNSRADAVLGWELHHQFHSSLFNSRIFGHSGTQQFRSLAGYAHNEGWPKRLIFSLCLGYSNTEKAAKPPNDLVVCHIHGNSGVKGPSSATHFGNKDRALTVHDSGDVCHINGRNERDWVNRFGVHLSGLGPLVFRLSAIFVVLINPLHTNILGGYCFGCK
jgi:hypothetical protein